MNPMNAVLVFGAAAASIGLMGCNNKPPVATCEVGEVKGEWKVLASGKTEGSTVSYSYGITETSGWERTEEWSASFDAGLVQALHLGGLDHTSSSTVSHSRDISSEVTFEDVWKSDSFVLWQWQGTIINKNKGDTCPEEMKLALKQTAWTDKITTKPVCIPGGCVADNNGRCCNCSRPEFEIPGNVGCDAQDCPTGKSQEVVIRQNMRIEIKEDIPAGEIRMKDCSHYNADYEGTLQIECKAATGEVDISVGGCRVKGAVPEPGACHPLEREWKITTNCAKQNYGAARNLFDCNPSSVWYVGPGQAKKVGGWAELTVTLTPDWVKVPCFGLTFYTPPKGNMGQKSHELAFQRYMISKRKHGEWIIVKSGECRSDPGELGWKKCDVTFGGQHRAESWKLAIQGNFGSSTMFPNGDMAIAGMTFDTLMGKYHRGITTDISEVTEYDGCHLTRASLTWVILVYSWTIHQMIVPR